MLTLSFCLKFSFLFTLSFHPISKCEIFTSTADLNELVTTEIFLIKILEEYINSEEQQLNILKRKLDVLYRKEFNKASENVEWYVSNPINAYKLIKRLTADWNHIETILNNMHVNKPSKDYLAKIKNTKETMMFPNEEDLTGAAVGIMKIQDMYRLDTSSLARGEIKGVSYSSELTASDCFELGKQLHNTGDYDYAQEWLEEAYSRVDRKTDNLLNLFELQRYLGSAKFQQKVISFKNLGLTPQQKFKMEKVFSSLSKVYDLENEVGKIGILQKRRDSITKFLENNKQHDQQLPLTTNSAEELISKLCRGDISVSNKTATKLKCRYFHGNNHFLTIAPFKVEEAHIEPNILIFHDVIVDNEIDEIKKIAQLHFRKAKIRDGGKTMHRTCKTSFLNDTEHEILPILSQRINDMTGLTMETAEPLSVVNYGIGGFHESHYDKMNDISLPNKMWGDRIATVLFYMSNVEEGGATIFPLLNVTVWPQKGSALIWHNLLSNGDHDLLSLHGGCPVLIGSKWIATKRVHEQDQMFLKPCELKQAKPPNFY